MINVKESPFNAIGDSRADDTAAIQSALQSTLQVGNTEVYIPPGIYRISSTLVVPSNVQLTLSSGCILTPLKDIHLIRLNPGASLSGGTIDCSALSNFSSACVYFDAADHFWGTLTNVQNIRLRGGIKYAGYGILMESTVNEGFIAFINFSNMIISNFNIGICLQANKTGSWINANNFSNISIDWCKTSIYLQNAPGSLGVDGNLFTNVQLQPEEGAERCIYCNSSHNKFNVLPWDLRESTTNIAVELTGTSAYNELYLHYQTYKDYIVDQGTDNWILGQNEILTKEAAGQLSQMQLFPRPYLAVSENWEPLYPSSIAGIQDDILAYAGIRYTIKGSGVLANNSYSGMFTPGYGNQTYWQKPTGQANFEVDLTSEPLYYIGIIGLIFANRQHPTNISIQATKLDNSVVPLAARTNNHLDLVICDCTAILRDGIKKLFFSFSGLETGQTNIACTKIFAASSYNLGRTWLSTGGGTLYGDLNIQKSLTVNGKKQIYATASPTSGTWNVADICWNSKPAPGSFAGWICVTAGVPGKWKGFGTIQA